MQENKFLYPNDKATLGIVCIIMIVLFACFGCSTVHKTSSTEKVRVDSVTTHTEVDNTLKKVDSAVKTEDKHETGYEVDTSTSRDIAIKFDTANKANSPVIIIESPDGMLTIDPGGRTITDISVKNKATGRKAGTTSQIELTDTEVKKVDSAQHSASENTNLTKDSKKKDTTKEKTGFPWIWVAISAAICLALYLVYRYFNKQTTAVVGTASKVVDAVTKK